MRIEAGFIVFTKVLHSILLRLSSSCTLVLTVCSIETITDAESNAAGRIGIIKQCALRTRIERTMLVACTEEVRNIQSQCQAINVLKAGSKAISERSLKDDGRGYVIIKLKE